MAIHASPTLEDFVGDGADAFRATFEMFPEPLGVLAAVRDDSGAIADFLTLWGNQRLEELAGMPLNVDPRPLLISGVAPSLRDIGQFDEYVRVVETGLPYADEVEFDGDVGPPGRRITGIFKVGITKLGDGMVAMWRDVTALVRAEEAVEHLAAIVESTDDAIVGADHNGVITAWNAGAERLLGWTREEIVGRHIGTIVPREERPTQRARYENLLAGGSFERFETHWVRRDRTLVDVVLTASPLRNRNGEIIGASAVVHDITEIKRIQAELTRSNAELEQFVAIAAHDLREPLAAISQFAELLERFNGEDLDDRGREIVLHIQRGTKRARNLLDGLREYSRVGRASPIREAVDLEALLEGLLELIGPALREAQGTVTVDALPTVLGDEAELSRVFQNLVLNALKFRAAEPPAVHVSATRETGGWLLCVRDNGVGVTERDRERIFEIFSRAHDDAVPGTGIGLAVCHKVVSRHGGRIWVEAAEGGGSAFLFTLPDVVAETAEAG
jgi:PAS domain S-box-containing protein